MLKYLSNVVEFASMQGEDDSLLHASIAQLVELLFCKELVVGSSPTRGPKYLISWRKEE